VPYANLTNPQTLNLYAMVSDNPESFVDLDGHGNFSQSNAAVGACSDSNTTACSQQIATQNFAAAQAQTAQNLASQVPSEVKAAIADSVRASNSPTEDDKKGGFHEESGIAGTNTSDKLVISPEKPGPYANPDTSSEAHTSQKPVDQNVANTIAKVTVSWHVHPSGSTATHTWNQPPSAGDRQGVVPGAINIVVGARNKTVYFYDSSSPPVQMDLN
jgi:hypothetical protein